MNKAAPVGGILSIISGGFGILFGAGVSVFSIFMNVMFRATAPYGSPGFPPEMMTWMMIIYLVMGIGLALIGALALVGGIYCLKRKIFGLALAGAIGGAITFFPTGIIAVIYTTMAQPEFQGPKIMNPTPPPAP